MFTRITAGILLSSITLLNVLIVVALLIEASKDAGKWVHEARKAIGRTVTLCEHCFSHPCACNKP